MSAFQRKLLRTVIRSNNFQRLDAINGIEVSAARSVGYTKFRRGLIVSSSLTDVATVTRSTTRLAQAQSGTWAEYAAGAPALNRGGLDVWEGTTNKCTNYNAAPNGSLTNMTKAGEAASTLTEVDDTAQLRADGFGALIDAGRMNGKVFKLDNSAGVADAYAIPFGVTGNTNQHAFSVVTRCSGTMKLSSVFGEGITTFGASATYVRRSTLYTPAASRGGQVVAGPGVVVYFILNQLEEKAYATPPVIVAGTSATRNADVITEAVSIPVGQAFTVVGKVIAPASLANSVVLADLGPASGSADELQIWANSASGGKLYAYAQSAGVGGASSTGVSISPGAPVGFAVSVSGGAVSLSVNGSAPVVLNMAGGAFAQALTKLTLGCSLAGGAQLNSTIRDLNVVMRAYSAAELQAASDVSLVWDEDFTTQTYRFVGDPYTSVTDLPLTTFTRATGGYGVNAAGALVWFAAGVPRVTDAGLTVEGAATNLAIRSQEFDSVSWLKSGVTVTADAGAAPDGTVTADLLNAGVGNSEHAPELGVSVTNGVAYTLSVHAKAGTESLLVLWNSQNGSMGTVNLLTGAVTGGVTAQALGNGWYRAQATFTASSTTSRQVRFYVKSSAVYTGSNETLYLWGAQLETGSVATSYIPTTTVAVSRNADVLVTADTVISPTIVAEITIPPSGPAYYHIFTHDDGTVSNRVKLYLDRVSMRIYTLVSAGGVNQNTLDLGVVTAGATYKIAMRTATGDFAASKNGAACVTSAAGTLPSVTTFRVGKDNSGGEWGPGIRKIKRLSTVANNAQLQALAA